MTRTLVIDSCCMLNLLATGRELEIVSALEVSIFDTPQTCGEPLTLWTSPDTDGKRIREPTSTDPLRHAGHLQTHPLDSEALIDAFVDAAARIKDTDASRIALAGVLKLPLMTDDQKERRVARVLFPLIELVSTLDVIAEAEAVLDWSVDELRSVAFDLRWRGNFAPPCHDPRGAWYEALLEG